MKCIRESSVTACLPAIREKIARAAAIRCLVAAGLLALATSSSCPAQSTSALIDTLMHHLAQRQQFSGSVLAAEKGTVIYKGAFGKANGEQNPMFTPATPCYLASLTKQFTAMAVMMLMERQKLSYSDHLSKYFPEFPPYAQQITIRHLLNHTSGIPDYVGLGLEHPGLTNNDVLNALVRQDSLDFPPGSKFSYSNSGYVLLAMIIEKVTGQSYRVFVKDNIFDPLGMENSYVSDGSSQAHPGQAQGFGRFGDADDYNLSTVGEGGIYSTVEDLFTWDQALYGDKLVEPSTLAEAFSRAKLNDGSESMYGFGWGIGAFDGETTVSHAGRYGGFNTYIKRFPRERNTVIFLTNHGFRNMSAIGNALVNILYGKPFALPKLSVAELMYGIWNSQGLPAALRRYHELKQNNDTTYDFQESELNELGYEFLGMKKIQEAIEILKLNVEEFPESWNVYDGLGEAYMNHGDKELAIHNYRKSLELNPENMNAVSMLKKLGAR